MNLNPLRYQTDAYSRVRLALVPIWSEGVPIRLCRGSISTPETGATKLIRKSQFVRGRPENKVPGGLRFVRPQGDLRVRFVGSNLACLGL